MEFVNDRPAAILLYQANCALSEALYPLLQGLEILLRNAFDRELVKAHGDAWFDRTDVFQDDELEIVAKAKESIAGGSYPFSPGRLVATLSLGFWVKLSRKFHSRELWNPTLRNAFAGTSLLRDHKRAHPRLVSLRDLRNRIAHHDRIIGRNLEADYGDILDTANAICPISAAMIRATCRFESVYAECAEENNFPRIAGNTAATMARGARLKWRRVGVDLAQGALERVRGGVGVTPGQIAAAEEDLRAMQQQYEALLPIRRVQQQGGN